MKLLFDHNLSFRLVTVLRDLYPGSVHVREVELQAVDDEVVWDYARDNGFVIVSKDAEFRSAGTRGDPRRYISGPRLVLARRLLAGLDRAG